MSWRIAVRHTTGYRYSQPVRASYNEARMTPLTGSGQQTVEARLEITPPVRPLRYLDYWGSQVHAFDVHVPHTELVVTATSVVETRGSGQPVPAGASWDVLASPKTKDRYSELLAPSRYVVAEDEVTARASALTAECSPAEAGRAATEWAHEQLTYERGWTGVHTTSDDARAAGKGVCQDFAHLSLAVLRAMGLPARYVSGYLCPKDAVIGTSTSGESHAWVEYWAGSWTAVDPTSLDEVGDRHVVVARGRDYADVRPLSGVYHGPPADALGVTVELTRLR